MAPSPFRNRGGPRGFRAALRRLPRCAAFGGGAGVRLARDAGRASDEGEEAFFEKGDGRES